MALSDQQCAAIWDEAYAAASAAAEAQNAKLPPERFRGFDCGFAWVVIEPCRGKFVNWCKAQKYGERGYKHGLHIWYSKFSTLATQSISVHQAAARAFASVLQKHGLNAYSDSRLD